MTQIMYVDHSLYAKEFKMSAVCPRSFPQEHSRVALLTCLSTLRDP